MNKTISRVLRTQSWTYCTDKQWFINNVYIEIWEESYVFNADINKNKHIIWTNTRTYCTDKNMLLTNLTIARFQRKIRNFGSLARNQLHMFSGTYCKKRKEKKAILSTTTENLVTPARTPAPDKGSIREIATGEITNSFYHSWRPSWRPLFAENSRASGGSAPGPPAGALRRAPGPHPYEKNCMFQTHTQIGLLAIIYNSYFSSFWSVCKTFFRAKSTQIWLALSARSISFFSSFLFSSQYNEQDHITSVTNTVMDILYRQIVINQQCIYWDLRRIVCFQRRYIF